MNTSNKLSSGWNKKVWKVSEQWDANKKVDTILENKEKKPKIKQEVPSTRDLTYDELQEKMNGMKSDTLGKMLLVFTKKDYIQDIAQERIPMILNAIKHQIPKYDTSDVQILLWIMQVGFEKIYDFDSLLQEVIFLLKERQKELETFSLQTMITQRAKHLLWNFWDSEI